MVDKNKETVTVYDKISKKYSEIFDKDTSDLPFLDKFLKHIRKGGKILDLGCGTGRITQYYSEKGFDVIGIELSKEMIKIAKTKYPGVEFICKDMRKIKFPKNSFDAVSLAYSLFHIEKKDVPNLMKQVENAIKPKGILFLVLQEGKGEVYVDEPLLPGKKLFLNLYSETEIKDILKANKFEILSIDRKKPELTGELPYNKLIMISRKR